MAVVHRMAIVLRLVQNTRLSYFRFIRAGHSGRPLLTSGRCSEVAVSTGLTVYRVLDGESCQNNLSSKLIRTRINSDSE